MKRTIVIEISDSIDHPKADALYYAIAGMVEAVDFGEKNIKFHANWMEESGVINAITGHLGKKVVPVPSQKEKV